VTQDGSQQHTFSSWSIWQNRGTLVQQGSSIPQVQVILIGRTGAIPQSLPRQQYWSSLGTAPSTPAVLILAESVAVTDERSAYQAAMSSNRHSWRAQMLR